MPPRSIVTFESDHVPDEFHSSSHSIESWFIVRLEAVELLFSFGGVTPLGFFLNQMNLPVLSNPACLQLKFTSFVLLAVHRNQMTDSMLASEKEKTCNISRAVLLFGMKFSSNVGSGGSGLIFSQNILP